MKPKPVYTLPKGEKDSLEAFFSIANPCSYCKYIQKVESCEYYRLGDTRPNAWCRLLGQRVSSHVGTCSAFRRPLTGVIRDTLSQVFTQVKDIYWWFLHRLHPKHQYHRVKTGLRPGYYDPCVRILAGIFDEAATFVAHQEDEANEFRWDYNESPEHRAAWDAFKAAAEFQSVYLADSYDDNESEAVDIAQKVLDNIGHLWY